MVTAVLERTNRGDEAGLVQRARAGEAGAFEAIVEAHSAGAYRVAAGMVGADEAEDIVQEVFLRVHQGLSTFRGEGSLRSWIYGIATKLSLHRLRTRRRWRWITPLGERDPVTRNAQHPDRPLELSERQAALETALQRLPEHQRAVVVLRAYEGLTYAEISAALGVRQPTVESRMARARQTLRGLMAEWLNVDDATNDATTNEKNLAINMTSKLRGRS